MDLVRWDPFGMLRELDMFADRSEPRRHWAPRLDIFDREKELVVRVEVPGIDPADIEVTVEDRMLTISGRRTLDETTEEAGFHRREIFSGEFKRTLALPEGLETDSIGAAADRGMLEITLPRKPEVLPRKIEVSVTG